MSLYPLVAAWLTWPVVLDPGGVIPGAERSDAWNSIWSLWFVYEELASGRLPLHTDLLQFPIGGRLVVADPLNGLLGFPLVAAFGPVVAYSLLVLGHLVFSGFAAHAFGRKLGGTGYVAGLGYMLAPVVLSHVHNGSSEAIAAGWLPLAGLALLAVVERGGAWRICLAALAMFTCALSGWYAGIGAWCLLLGLLVVHRLPRLALVGVLAVGATLPWARAVREVARAEDGLVHIKNDDDMARLRRTLGAADVRTFFVPGPYRSPDFQHLEGRPGDYVHTSYLGFTLILLALVATWRRRDTAPWWIALAIAIVLALGPVVVLDGFPASFKGRAIPLPYLALEKLPGFDALSLLYRFSGAAVLALAAMAERALPRREDRWLGLVAGAVVALEFLFVAPTAGLPELSEVPVSPALEALDDAPAGAVVNLPVTASRAYLYEQVLHGKPLAASLNTGANRAALEVFTAARLSEGPDEVSRTAEEQGVRYVVVHKDLLIAEAFVRSAGMIRANFVLLAEDDRVRIYQLY
ncbi:MAG TPA: hypothetical protein QGF58_01675 [Myxococcota bacterium]|nr:hypothetical protein [Myxococcota bacterium]